MALSDAEIAGAIDGLLDRRGPGKTICPSDAARALAGEDFRPLMDDVRRVAGTMVSRGTLEVTQGGEVVDLEGVRGPIRLRRPAQS